MLFIRRARAESDSNYFKIMLSCTTTTAAA
jgi:hypothetical protein